LTSRAAGAEDEPFLLALFESTLDTAALPQVSREALVQMQYAARRSTYSRQFPGSEQLLILTGQDRAGAFTILREPHEVRLIDMALLPEYRGSGIGTQLLRMLMEEAATAGKPLRLSVAMTNIDAIRLYRRLGFRLTGESGMHLQMEMAP
jgi:ribosomal protein S18 acetylase RimI-like enzyme